MRCIFSENKKNKREIELEGVDQYTEQKLTQLLGVPNYEEIKDSAFEFANTVLQDLKDMGIEGDVRIGQMHDLIDEIRETKNYVTAREEFERLKEEIKEVRSSSPVEEESLSIEEKNKEEVSFVSKKLADIRKKLGI